MLEANQNASIDERYDALIDCMVADTTSQSENLRRSDRAVSTLAEHLGISRIEEVLEVIPSVFVPEGEVRVRVLYEKGAVNEKAALPISYDTFDRGKETFNFYPEVGKCFSPEKQEQIQHLSKLLFILEGKRRKDGLLKIVLYEDLLTKLPNGNAFKKRIEHLGKEQNVSLYDAYCFNVKNFKYINKLVNYQKGDSVMAQYAKKLKTFQVEGEMIARLGGDNFVALILRERRVPFLRFINGIELDVETPLGMKKVVLGAVAGILELSKENCSVDEVMSSTTIAMYAGRQLFHKEYFVYNDEISNSVIEGQRIHMEFDQHLQAGNFIAYYQPKFNLITGKLCGAEALVRWKEGDVIIPPIRFIPLLERDGSICRLDFEMLRQTCEQIAKWLRMGKEPVRISVNLSRWHLQNPNLVSEVKEIIDSYGIDPKYIEVELTETVSFEEYDVMKNIVCDFKKQGITTSIDDFGTGYSSLNLLKNLDVDVLKIDKSFLDEIGNGHEGKKDRIMLENIIKLARDFDIEVVAEGVETKAQRDFLVEVNCHMAQGYLYAKPLPIEEFEKILFS